MKNWNNGTIKQRIDGFVNAIIEDEENKTIDDKQRISAQSSTVRMYKRWLGIEKKTRDAHKKYSERTVLKHLSHARKKLSESVLQSNKAKQEVLKAAKAYPQFSETLNNLAGKKKIKSARNRMIADPNTPRALKTVLKKIKLEHHTYYRLMNSRMGAEMQRIKAVKKELDNKAIVDKNKGVSKKTLRVSKPLVLKAVEDGLRSDQVHATRMGVALILCTGRRNIELVRTGSFEVVDDNTLLFSGQAKKKHGEVAESYEIPVMFADSKQVIECFKRFRKTDFCKKLKRLDNEEVARRISSTLSDSTRTRLQNNYATFYSARSIYGNSAYEEYIKNRKEDDLYTSKSAYLSKLLGHDEDDIKSAQSYEGVNVDEDLTALQAKEAFNKQKKEKLKESHSKEKEHQALPRLNELLKVIPAMEHNVRSANTQIAIAQWVIAACKENSNFVITATNIRKFKGGRMEPIKEVLSKLERV